MRHHLPTALGKGVQVMILETAVLDVRAGMSHEFEAAFSVAKNLPTQIAGYQNLELRKCAEKPRRYLLLIWWDSIESHTVGFRESPQYQEWKRLLHHFYDPFPEVEHYSLISGDAA